MMNSISTKLCPDSNPAGIVYSHSVLVLPIFKVSLVVVLEELKIAERGACINRTIPVPVIAKGNTCSLVTYWPSATACGPYTGEVKFLMPLMVCAPSVRTTSLYCAKGIHADPSCTCKRLFVGLKYIGAPA